MHSEKQHYTPGELNHYFSENVIESIDRLVNLHIDIEEPTILERLLYVIIQSTDAERVYLLNTYPAAPDASELEYDFLILMNNFQNRPPDQWESLVQNRSRDIAPVFISVFSVARVNAHIAADNAFFINACTPEKLVYNAGRTAVAEAKLNAEHIQYNHCYSSFITRAERFLQTATDYSHAQEYSLVCFVLHQTVEQALSALLVPIMQFHLKTHNLARLLRMARRVSLEVYSVFPRQLKNDSRLFSLLQQGYIHGRYSSNFIALEEEAALLTERCSLLLQLVKETHARQTKNSIIAA